MAGICGIYNQNSQQIRDIDLRKMLAAIRHRGPDAEDFYLGENFGMGVCSLKIDSAPFKQDGVFNNEDETIFLVCDGFIYNFRELKMQLENKGHHFKTKNDCEVILHLYEDEGSDLCAKLNGDFVFALWDEKNKQLILGRDRLGVKPLYYSVRNANIIFGSEIKSILAYPRFQKKINYEALSYFFSGRVIPSPLTAFEGIKSLNPGTILFYKKGKFKEKKYWQLHFDEKYNFKDAEAVKKMVRKELENSIKSRLNFPLSPVVALSGGLDSSILTALISKFSRKPVKTFYVKYPQKSLNKSAEFERVKKISNFLGTRHANYEVCPKDYLDSLEKIITAFDNPISVFSGHYFIGQAARKLHHSHLFFEGDGSEELFGGYWYHFFSKIIEDHLDYISRFDPKKVLIAKKVNYHIVELIFLLRNYDWRFGQPPVSLFGSEAVDLLFAPSFVKKIESFNPFRQTARILKTATAKGFLNKVLESDIKIFFPNHTLQVVDRLSMVNSAVPCSPFADFRLFELSAKLPSSLKLLNVKTSKYILREAIKDLLPEKFLYSDFKEGGGVPIREWLLFDFEKFIKATLSPKRINRHSFFRSEYVNTLLKEHYANRNFSWFKKKFGMKFQKAGADHTLKIWNLVLFQLWWEKYFN